MGRSRARELGPGDSHSVRLRGKDDPLVIQWFNEQTNITESIIYLIEEHIRINGVLDLAEIMPMKRKPLSESIQGNPILMEESLSVKPIRSIGMKITPKKKDIESPDTIQPFSTVAELPTSPQPNGNDIEEKIQETEIETFAGINKHSADDTGW